MANYFKLAFVLLLAEVVTAHPKFMMPPFHRMRMMRGFFPPPFHPFAFQPRPGVSQTVLQQTVLPQQQPQQSRLTVIQQPAGQPALLPATQALLPALPATQALLPALPPAQALLPALPAPPAQPLTTTTQLLLQQLQILLQQQTAAAPQPPLQLLPTTQPLQLQQLQQLLQLLTPQNQLQLVQPTGVLGTARAEAILTRLAQINERLATSLEASGGEGAGGQVMLSPALQTDLRALNLASQPRSRSMSTANSQASGVMGPTNNFAPDIGSINAGQRF